MDLSARVFLLVSFLLGLSAGVGGALAMGERGRPPPAARAAPEPPPAEDDRDDELVAANLSLVRSLQACNRRLEALGARQEQAPAASASPLASAIASGVGRRDRRRGPPSKEDWERFAEEGVVPYRIPCLRDAPYTPTAREIERLGLAPDDVEALRQAYARSNERVIAQLRPLCGGALGSAEVAERIGPSACLKALLDGSRRENPEKMREALTRVAEVNAGKRPAPGDTPVEALLLGLTAEQQKFEADLAASFGPEEARRIASSRAGCSEQGVASADGNPRGGRGRGR